MRRTLLLLAFLAVASPALAQPPVDWGGIEWGFKWWIGHVRSLFLPDTPPVPEFGPCRPCDRHLGAVRAPLACHVVYREGR